MRSDVLESVEETLKGSYEALLLPVQAVQLKCAASTDSAIYNIIAHEASNVVHQPSSQLPKPPAKQAQGKIWRHTWLREGVQLQISMLQLLLQMQATAHA